MHIRKRSLVVPPSARRLEELSLRGGGVRVARRSYAK